MKVIADFVNMPIWRQAFRPFFLAGSLFSIVALAVWTATFSVTMEFSPHGNSLLWHAHEMLFGFICAIIVGFLLTAVQSWTGLRAINGAPLLALFSLWLMSRILMIVNIAEMEWLIALVDISFLPCAGVFFAKLVIKAGSKRNFQFIPVVAMLTGANILTHLSVLLDKPELFTWGMRAAIMQVVLIMTVVGGRVVPLFTASGARVAAVKPLPWLEKTVLGSTWLLAIVYIVNGVSFLPRSILAGVFAVAALSNAYRVLRWRVWTALSIPLVWSLHLAYWFIPVGFGLFALSYAGFVISESTALHSLTAGAMGSLILAMIARVSLGHSGRPLTAHWSLKFAFIFIVSAGITRVLTGLYPSLLAYNGYSISAGLWILAYTIYTAVYLRILTTTRVDGKPG